MIFHMSLVNLLIESFIAWLFMERHIMRVRQGVGEPNRIYVLIPGKEDAALA